MMLFTHLPCLLMLYLCTMTSFLSKYLFIMQPSEIGVDRISYLPKVLCHILYFLLKKLTIRTSILSKIGDIYGVLFLLLTFDDTLLFNPNKGGFHGIGGVNFINFVDRDWLEIVNCLSICLVFVAIGVIVFIWMLGLTMQ